MVVAPLVAVLPGRSLEPAAVAVAADQPATTAFHPVTPCRLADTRSGTGLTARFVNRTEVLAAGRCGVPEEATAVVVTVTATGPQAAGYLTAWPAGTTVPNASTLNFAGGEDRANGAIVTLGVDGAIAITTSVPTNWIIDVNGWFAPTATARAGRFVATPPRRLFDTRAAGFERPLAAGEEFTLALPADVPADATALALNVTTTAPNEPGYFTLYPAGADRPAASALNTDGADQTRAAGVIAPVSADGLTVYANNGGHFIVDISGWFTGESTPESDVGLFVPAGSPVRLTDTRTGDPIWDGGTIDVATTVADASAVAINTTLIDALAWGFLTAFPARTAPSGTSTVNAGARGETAANFAIVPQSSVGIGVTAHGGADFVADLAGWFTGAPVAAPGAAPTNVRPPVCASNLSPSGLTEFFADGYPLAGADYQRSYPLPDGRVLWLFQDVLVQARGGPRFLHNAGLVQTNNCFTLLQTGDYGTAQEYLIPWGTQKYSRWFWPLGGDMGADGHFHVFAAEMVERSGTKYLGRTEPVATWHLTIRLSDMEVIAFEPAADRSAALYGWSVTSDASYTYLYSHCYKQFGWDLWPFSDPPLYAHDFDCTDDITVARIPRGQFGTMPRYWNGFDWVADRSAAVPVIPNWERTINPAQVTYVDGRFLAVTKEGDWWGDTIYLDVAPAAQGPWRTYRTISMPDPCGGCNTYFASFVPYRAPNGALMVGLSRNTFEGMFTGLYTPTFFTIPSP